MLNDNLFQNPFFPQHIYKTLKCNNFHKLVLYCMKLKATNRGRTFKRNDLCYSSFFWIQNSHYHQKVLIVFLPLSFSSRLLITSHIHSGIITVTHCHNIRLTVLSSGSIKLLWEQFIHFMQLAVEQTYFPQTQTPTFNSHTKQLSAFSRGHQNK